MCHYKAGCTAFIDNFYSIYNNAIQVFHIIVRVWYKMFRVQFVSYDAQAPDYLSFNIYIYSSTFVCTAETYSAMNIL